MGYILELQGAVRRRGRHRSSNEAEMEETASNMAFLVILCAFCRPSRRETADSEIVTP